MTTYPHSGIGVAQLLDIILPQQPSAEVPLNMAIVRLFMLLQASVLDRDLTVPAGTEIDGDRLLVATGGTGAFATHDGDFAYKWNGTWYFVTPEDGYLLWITDEKVLLVREGSTWVDARRATLVCLAGEVASWTTQPSALTDFRGITAGAGPVYSPYTAILDLRSVTKIALGVAVHVIGHTTAKLRLQYSIDSGANWAYLDAAGANAGPSVSIAALGPVKSTAVVIDAAARTAATWVKLVGLDGNAAVSPQIGNVQAELQ